MLNKNELLEKLTKSNFKYIIKEHEPLFTVKDSIKNRGQISGGHSKNLFLKNKKNHFFLFSCLEKTKIELKKLSKSLNIGNISFAKETDLYDLLGVLPGSVTPFGLLNDTQKKVTFYLDSGFLSYKTINFHPLRNTETVNMSVSNFIDFLIENKKKVNIFDFNNYSLI
jgi:Ala-tRNA(Pro) deacylase